MCLRFESHLTFRTSDRRSTMTGGDEGGKDNIRWFRK